MTRRYKAFISYSWADRTWGEWLHRTLETYRAPSGVADGKTLHPIFKDREEEAAGGSVGAAIEAALGASEFLIVICSPRSAQSTWVNREVAWFKTHKDKANILALIVDGEPGASAIAGREAEECFPKTLTRKVASDLQPTEEWEDAPLAADARTEGDGRRGAKLKLAAALLGVGLDALVRRDERRRTIRRRFVTGASLGLAAVLGGLAIYAFTQRDAAVVARNEAVNARDDAESLIELILEDLKEDLDGYGTLKSVTKIGDRAIGYYEEQDVKALTPDQLGRRARVLLMLGEADNERGDLMAALARYETAAATTQEQLTRNPESPQRMFDHAQSVFWVGYIAWQRGDRAAAKRQFTEYHDLAQKLVASDPANEDWQAELDYAYSNLGTLAMDDGDAAAAEGYFRKSLALALARLAKAPEDIERLLSAGQAYAWLADSLHRQVNLDRAREVRLNELHLYDPHLRKSAINAEIVRATTVAEYALAQIDIALGDITGAAKRAERAIAFADAVLKRDPSRAEFLSSAAIARGVLGEAHIHLGNLAAARESLAISIRNSDQLRSLDTTSVWSGYPATLPQLLMARAEIGSKNIDSARERLSRIIRDQSELDAASIDPVRRRVLVLSLATRARLNNSRVDWLAVIDILGKTTSRESPETIAVLAEALLKSGAVAEGRQLAAKLYNQGYRHPDFIAATSGVSLLSIDTKGSE